jgi:hypothetical protein
MYRIRELYQHGLAGVKERRYYSRLWLALALRRSLCSRARPSATVCAALTDWNREFDAVQRERLRVAVDAAFWPGDTSVQDARSPLST